MPTTSVLKISGTMMHFTRCRKAPEVILNALSQFSVATGDSDLVLRYQPNKIPTIIAMRIHWLTLRRRTCLIMVDGGNVNETCGRCN